MELKDVEPFKREIRKEIIDRAEKEYKVLSDTYDMIDRKAQATTAIAGALLAVALAFAARVDGDTNGLVLLLILGITLVLFVSEFSSVFAMLALSTDLPPTGQQCRENYEAVLEAATLDNMIAEDVKSFNEAADHWRLANASVSGANSKKAKRLKAGQYSLMLAATLTAALTILLVFRPDMMTLKATAPSADSNRADVGGPGPSASVVAASASVAGGVPSTRKAP